MRAHYIQHVPFEGPGHIETWLKEKECEITCTRLYEEISFPEINLVDFLIVMGGPMSVSDETSIQWLHREKEYIYKYIQSGKPLLGICLGAQLIANVLGARVYKNTLKEIGWFSIRHKIDLPFTNGDNIIDAFHWHGETFDLPEKSVHLAESDGCKNQAFRYNNNVYGFQFHLEATPETVEMMLMNCGEELIIDQFVQNASEIKAKTRESYYKANMFLEGVLTKIINDYYNQPL